MRDEYISQLVFISKNSRKRQYKNFFFNVEKALILKLVYMYIPAVFA